MLSCCVLLGFGIGQFYPYSLQGYLLAVGQSYDCPIASGRTLKNICKSFMCIQSSHDLNMMKQSKTVCISACLIKLPLNTVGHVSKCWSYHHRDFHNKDKTVSGPSCIYNGITYTWKDRHLYENTTLVFEPSFLSGLYYMKIIYGLASKWLSLGLRLMVAMREIQFRFKLRW